MSNDIEDPGHSRLPFSPPYGWILSGLFLLLFSWAARSEDLDPTLRARWASDVGMAGRKGVSDGRVAFVLTGEAGNELAVLDVSNPAHPRPVGRRGIPGARDLALADQHLYVAAFTHGLRIIDVRNPSLPKIEAFLSATGLVTHVAVHQGIACVLEMPRTNPPPDGSAGTLLIADITDPGRPRWIGDYLISMEGRSDVSLADVAISEGLACIVSHGYNPSAARRESTLDVIDLSNPADPRRTVVHRAAGDALAVAMSGR
ncbi:MAG: hypothetical protein L6Q38_15925, partial [Nitrospira sp.]|nr:hypothetical protein [Nitrospira sp.]